MILGQNEIRRLLDNETDDEKKLISNVNLDSCKQRNNPAKVDLSLGDKCYVSSDANNIVVLNEKDKVTIPPNAIFFYQTFQKVNLPSNIAGKISLKMGLTAKGLLMSNQTQIDPGYKNYVFGMLYNLSNRAITLEHKQFIVSLELFYVEKPGIPYSGSMHCSFEEFIKTRIHSSLGLLDKSLKHSQSKLDKAVDNANWINILLPILIAIIGMMVAIPPIKSMFDVPEFKTKFEIHSKQSEEYKKQIAKLQARMAVLESKIASETPNLSASSPASLPKKQSQTPTAPNTPK